MKYTFIITTCINCPLYKTGDIFILSDTVLSLPLNKAACLILARDMTELMLSLTRKSSDSNGSSVHNCNGCSGLVKFKQLDELEGKNNHKNPINAGFTGHLDSLSPEELMQTLNLNQKTGSLVIEDSSGTVTIFFKNGQVITSNYQLEKGDTLQGAQAFHLALRMTGGSFIFSPVDLPSLEQSKPIGDFMSLLMEGLQQIDEE